MVNIRDEKCIKCAKFSHCNNNGLVCISKFKALEQEYEQFKQTNVNKQLYNIVTKIEQEVKFVIDNKEHYDLRDIVRCERILDIINKAQKIQ